MLGQLFSTLLHTFLKPTHWKVAQPGFQPGRADTKAGVAPSSPSCFSVNSPHTACSARLTGAGLRAFMLSVPSAYKTLSPLYTAGSFTSIKSLLQFHLLVWPSLTTLKNCSIPSAFFNLPFLHGRTSINTWMNNNVGGKLFNQRVSNTSVQRL